MSAPLIDVAVEVVRETEKAFQVSEDGGKTLVWLPKSQVEWHQDKPGKMVGTMVMPEWLAKDKGLI
jgi:hypothetical protein